jgi:hypothetical protein
VLAHLLGVGLILEPDHAAGGHGIHDHRAVLEAQCGVEALDLGLDVHLFFW